MDNLKIGNRVNFIVERSLLKGIITKFYKNSYGRDECSVKVDFANGSKSKTFAHISLHRVTKINDDEKDQQVAELKKQLEEKDKKITELEELTDSIVSTAYYKLAKVAEVKKLKDQLKSQPKEIMEKIKGPIKEAKRSIRKRCKGNTSVSGQDLMVLRCYDQTFRITLKILDEILKEYGEKYEN